ncbi:hypothetical protein ACFPRD_40410, partial [Streptomyces kaempferi]
QDGCCRDWTTSAAETREQSHWAIDATPVSTRRLREAVIQTLQMPFQRADLDVTQIPEGGDDDAFALRQEMAAQI